MIESRLDEFVTVKGRFARSVRSDRDTGQAAQIAGYLPTSRSLEVIRRLTNGMSRADGVRAFSITGPYGSGKSSLAVFLDSLLGPTSDIAYQTAVDLLSEYDPATAQRLTDARECMGADASGFVRAVITAPQRESITTTVLRALERGARRSRVAKKVRDQLDSALERAVSSRYASPSFHEVHELIGQLSARKPVLLVIDEFGKNLEAFSDGGSEGDLYLLQELAEWAAGEDRLPLVLMTIQHLAFEAYGADATASQRREWAKVQGRFEDISYVDTAAATRGLIAAALQHSENLTYRRLLQQAAQNAGRDADAAGLASVTDAELIAACYPLHPSTLLVLPSLCARYGQNERTLFSFLASDEPNSVTTFTHDADLTTGLPWVRLDRVYDYFVESASTFLGASRDANRWVEVETNIRDVHGLTLPQLRVLKTVGVLNLIAAAGAVRASNELLGFALAGSGDGLEDQVSVQARTRELVELGLITYRDFASEYRIWQGSDFDITASVSSARRQIRRESIAETIVHTMPLRAVVASRHSITRNTMRAFARTFADDTTVTVSTPSPGDVRDGVLVYALAPDIRPAPAEPDVPVVVIEPSREQLDALVAATVEVAALRRVLADPNLADTDRAARRELAERLALARQILEQRVEAAYGPEGTWTWINPPGDGNERPLTPRRASDALSDVFDEVYRHGPEVKYEAINRAELTSQGSKGRRILLEAALTPSRAREHRLGLAGDGPEVGMYRAVLADAGIHHPDHGFNSPRITDAWAPVWNHLNATLKGATGDAISAAHVLDEIMRPPFGLRQGVASVLLSAALIRNAHDIAIYEHGTFKPRFDAAMSERLVRNPDNFAVKHLAASGTNSKRYRALEILSEAVATAIEAPKPVRPTVLATVTLLLRPFHTNATNYTRRTKQFGAAWSTPHATPEYVATLRAVRDALVRTQEPDILLFEALPVAVGYGPLTASGRGTTAMRSSEIERFARQVADAVKHISRAYDELCRHILKVILAASQAKDTTMLAGDAAHIDDLEVVSTQVRTFASLARMADALEPTTFAQQVATAITGTPPSEWADADIPGAITRIRETASSFRRVAALAQASRAQLGGEPFDAIAIDITSTDGRHLPEVVAIRESDRAALSDSVAAMLHDARDVLGDDQMAARALIALLAEHLLDAAAKPSTDTAIVRQERTHG